MDFTTKFSSNPYHGSVIDEHGKDFKIGKEQGKSFVWIFIVL
jgi:hypothetical protein